MAVRIITDSGCDIVGADNPQLDVLSLSITFGSTVYADGVDLSHEHFYELLVEGDELPKQLFACLPIALPQPKRKDCRMPGAHEHAERPEQHHHRERQGKAGHCRLAASPADVEAIDNGIKRVEAHRHEGGP